MQLSSKFRLSLILTLFSIIVTGCDSTITEKVDQPIEKQSIVGTNGQLIAIQSDNVAAAGYDAESKVMTVQINNGYTYEYYGIQAELWNSFIAAQPHPWSQVGYPRLVQAGVPYRRIR